MKISQTKDIRSANRLTIIKHILNKKQISRARISEETGLNKATVSTIVKEWMSLKLVEETTMGDSSGGRRPIILTLAAKAGYCIAIDIGVRRLGLILTDLNNEIISRQSIPVEKQAFSHVYQQIYIAIDRMIREIPPCPYGLIGISLAVRGIIDLDGVIRFIPKLQWHNIDIKSLLEQRYHVPVYIDNDGNLAASMESRLHPQYEELTVLCLTDVISCGMISNGRLIRGYLGFANAVGHHTINIQETKQCSCGKYGCWEQYCSDQYLLDEANLHLETPLEDIDGFIELVRKQNPLALGILDTYIKNLAIGLSNIIFFVNCEMIILNSHLIQSLPYLMPEIMKDIILPITHTQEILISTLGNEAPILGASLKAIEEFFEILSAHG
uniref:ROK family transcriptional regulator n=1 Tax=Enterocloster hominis (ex Hitch et al. 2024) TaxID=1917870 RepID=UPI001030FBD1|nr:ROK family transcriptional regulator [Lachnoclostridium pacaense]